MDLYQMVLMVSKNPILFFDSNLFRSVSWLLASDRIYLFSAMDAFILSTSFCKPFPEANSRTMIKKVYTSIACSLSNVKISISNVW